MKRTMHCPFDGMPAIYMIGKPPAPTYVLYSCKTAEKREDPGKYSVSIGELCTGVVEMIDLEQQLSMFELRKWIVLDELRVKLQDPEFLAEIMRLAKERLQQGYQSYGETMYHWDEDTRIDNMNQELADYIVYGTSREV